MNRRLRLAALSASLGLLCAAAALTVPITKGTGGDRLRAEAANEQHVGGIVNPSPTYAPAPAGSQTAAEWWEDYIDSLVASGELSEEEWLAFYIPWAMGRP